MRRPLHTLACLLCGLCLAHGAPVAPPRPRVLAATPVAPWHGAAHPGAAPPSAGAFRHQRLHRGGAPTTSKDPAPPGSAWPLGALLCGGTAVALAAMTGGRDPSPPPPPGEDPAAPTSEGSSPAPGEGAAPRDAVLAACLETTALLTAVGAAARWGSHGLAAAGVLPPHWDLSAALPLWPAASANAPLLADGLPLLVGVGAGLLVTAVRTAVLRSGAWPAFGAATDRSNGRALGALPDADLWWVAALPALSEELVFRGVLQPLLGNGAPAVLAAAAVFGALHLSGGRNVAFAAWATGVGALYGGVALATHAVAPAMVAHAVGNWTSAVAWRSFRNPRPVAPPPDPPPAP